MLHKASCKNAVKPSDVQSFDMLSAKQLKNIMKAKAATYESNKRKITLEQIEKIVEKPQLVKFVEERVQLSEIESLLSAAESASNSSSSSSSSSSASKVKKPVIRTPPQNHLPTPTPEQLKQQAAMIRKDPGSVRRANPAFAKMTDEQIRAYADQLEKVIICDNSLAKPGTHYRAIVFSPITPS
jgi:hypothetical protein